VGRYTGPSCKLCRRERTKLFLKGARCETAKCAIEQRNFPPGVHGQRRAKDKPYGLQLRERQKARRMYGISEKQMRNYFHRAERRPGMTGETLLSLLERRLDNVVFRLGFAGSRSQARQLVGHKHFTVNDKLVNIASYLVNEGDLVSVREKSRNLEVIKSAMEAATLRGVPEWLELDVERMIGRVKRLPNREDIAVPVVFALRRSLGHVVGTGIE
jgi:small subunit ribosomal protein S4